MALTETDRVWLARCVDLAEKALDDGHEPFGSILVDAAGQAVREEMNAVGNGDATQHPEFALARWAAQHMSVEARARATVYTSGEHCPMCAAAHAWVGLGRIVYASSAAQLVAWLGAMPVDPLPVAALSINDVAPYIPVDGPDTTLADSVRSLHERLHRPSSQPKT